MPIPTSASSTAELIDRLVQRTDDNTYALTIPDENELSLYGIISKHDIDGVAKKHGIKRIDIRTPDKLQGSAGYQLARRVCDWVLANCKTLSQSILEKGVVIRVQDGDKSLAGDWYVYYKTDDSCVTKIKNLIPFLSSTTSKTIVPLSVERCVGVAATITSLFTSVFTPQTQTIPETPPTPTTTDVRLTIAQRIQKANFDDEFTQIATKALQRMEKHWIYSSTHKGNTRFIASNDFLSIEPIPTDPKASPSTMAKEAVKLYKEFLLSEYGPSIVENIRHRLKIDLDTLPALYPDHVFKCNIAALDLHMQDVDLLFHKLQKIQSAQFDVELTAVESPFVELFSSTSGFSIREIRGINNLLKKELNKEIPTIKDFYEFMNQMLPTEIADAKNLTPKQFNQLLSIIMPSKADRKRAYTGREILDRPIMGFHTMGDQNDINPTRDVHEHTQVFEDMKQLSWSGFFEILGHVSVKKTALRSKESQILTVQEKQVAEKAKELKKREDTLTHEVEIEESLFTSQIEGAPPKQENHSQSAVQWYTGLLLPAPSENGEERWYYVDAILDDNQGLVGHVLLPACEGYTYTDKRYTNNVSRKLPLIFLQRSTNSATNGISSYDSLQADLNPFGAPGSLDPYASKEYQLKYLKPRTIPLWVGYLLRAKETYTTLARASQLAPLLQEEIISKIKKYLLRSLKILEDELHQIATSEEGKQQVNHLLEKISQHRQILTNTDSLVLKQASDTPTPIEETVTLLEQHANTVQELPKYKQTQDIAYVGHSLGGALSQQFLHHYGPKLNRIPTQSATFICYSSDGPATDVKNDVEFMQFGNAHRKVLSFVSNNRKWHVTHQLEYGDFVPQSGGNHLGTEDYTNPKSKLWLDFSAMIFKPLPTATVKEIYAAPTHGRRIALGLPNGPKENVDYHPTNLTQKMLYDFDHAWILGPELANIFGYKVLSSPKLTEWLRLQASRVAYLGFRGHEAVYRLVEDPFKSVPRDQAGVMYVSYTPPPFSSQLALNTPHQTHLATTTTTTTTSDNLLDSPSNAA